MGQIIRVRPSLCVGGREAPVMLLTIWVCKEERGGKEWEKRHLADLEGAAEGSHLPRVEVPPVSGSSRVFY